MCRVWVYVGLTRSLTMVMIGKVLPDAPPREEVGAGDRQGDEPGEEHGAQVPEARQGRAAQYRRPAVPTKLAPFVEALDRRCRPMAPPKKHGAAQGAAGSCRPGLRRWLQRLTDYIRALARATSKARHQRLRPLSFELGDAFQFDWSEEPLVIGGIYRRLQVAHLKLCASRAFWLVAYPTQGHEMLFDAHTRSFAALGGVARRGIYDNMKTAVDKVGRRARARGQQPLRGDVRALPVRPRLLQRRLGLGEGPWRRTCRTAGGASGWRRAPALLRTNSMPGWASAAGAVGRDRATRAQGQFSVAEMLELERSRT